MNTAEIPNEIGEKALSLAQKSGARVTTVHLYLESRLLKISGILSDVFAASPFPSHLKSMLSSNGINRLIIDARDAAADQNGVQCFRIFAHESLRHCALVFVPSQLSEILQVDDKYEHADSQFLESPLPTPIIEDQAIMEFNVFSISEETLEKLGLKVDGDMLVPNSPRRMVEVRPNKRYREELATRVELGGQLCCA